MFQQPLSALPRGQNSYSAAIGEEEKGEERKKKEEEKWCCIMKIILS